MGCCCYQEESLHASAREDDKSPEGIVRWLRTRSDMNCDCPSCSFDRAAADLIEGQEQLLLKLGWELY